MRSTTLEQLSAADAEAILKYLPERIRAALIARAAEIESDRNCCGNRNC